MSILKFEGWEAHVSLAESARESETFLVRIGEREHTVRLLSHEAGLISFEVDGRVLRASVQEWGGVETRGGGGADSNWTAPDLRHRRGIDTNAT